MPRPRTQDTQRLGRYTLLRPLGAGGMAELFLARAEGIEGFSKLVAVKRILPHRASNARFVRMFLDEARLVAGLDHPNIAQVYDIGQEDGEYFFAMEYVHGPDLRRILQVAPGHTLQLENVLHVAIGLSAGLHCAHEARDESGRSLAIVHRDVSPSNVLVSYQGAVKLVDFGVAKAATIVSETNDGVVKGKYGYMSPEQCLSDPLTRQSDVFNVGILLWEMTVGRRLYKINGDLAALQRIVYVDAPPPSRYIHNYPRELERIVMRALARDPAKRYQTAEQLQLELEAFALQSRIPVSAVSMGLEMRSLFHERIEAWQRAQAAGRSLADHLAEISADDPVASSEDHEIPGNIDEILAELDTGTAGKESLAGETRAERPILKQAESAPPALVPQDAKSALEKPPAKRSRLLFGALAFVGIGIAGAGGIWMSGMLDVDDPQSAGAASTGTQPAPPPTHTLTVTAIPDDDHGADSGDPAVDGASPAPIVADDSHAAIAAEDSTAPTSPSAAPAKRTPEKHPPPRDDRRRRAKPEPPPVVRRDAKPEPKPEPNAVVARNDKPAAKPDAARNDNPTANDAARNDKPTAKPDAVRDAKPELDQLPKITPPADAGPRPGTVDSNGVRAVARAHLPEITSCVARARMDNRDLTGRVVIRIDVSPTGAVTRTSVAGSTGATPTLEGCMMKTVATWTFPAPAGGVRGAFSYPFTF